MLKAEARLKEEHARVASYLDESTGGKIQQVNLRTCPGGHICTGTGSGCTGTEAATQCEPCRAEGVAARDCVVHARWQRSSSYQRT